MFFHMMFHVHTPSSSCEWWSNTIHLFSKTLNENGVQFPEEKNSFVLHHQFNGRHDIMCKPATELKHVCIIIKCMGLSRNLSCFSWPLTKPGSDQIGSFPQTLSLTFCYSQWLHVFVRDLYTNFYLLFIEDSHYTDQGYINTDNADQGY